MTNYPGFLLVQTNFSRLRHPIDAPETREFADNLDRVNGLAERSPGYVWRLIGEGGDATDLLPFPDDPLTILNLSVWESIETLQNFAFRTVHYRFWRRREEWFEPYPRGAATALWWMPRGASWPDVAEAVRRLSIIDERGVGPEAFDFAETYAPDGARLQT